MICVIDSLYNDIEWSIGLRNISMFREYLICFVILLFEFFEIIIKIKFMVIFKILELKWKNGFFYLWLCIVYI